MAKKKVKRRIYIVTGEASKTGFKKPKRVWGQSSEEERHAVAAKLSNPSRKPLPGADIIQICNGLKISVEDLAILVGIKRDEFHKWMLKPYRLPRDKWRKICTLRKLSRKGDKLFTVPHLQSILNPASKLKPLI